MYHRISINEGYSLTPLNIYEYQVQVIFIIKIRAICYITTDFMDLDSSFLIELEDKK